MEGMDYTYLGVIILLLLAWGADLFGSKPLSRKEKILQECGCICYCPFCKEPLNDQAKCEEEEDGRVIYTCSVCDQVSEWHFGIAPVPILLTEVTNDQL